MWEEKGDMWLIKFIKPYLLESQPQSMVKSILATKILTEMYLITVQKT